MKTALLISTYNWPEALELIFKSIELQTKMPYEILIADDGSKPQTKELIESFRNKTQLNVIHVWQEDIGFRKAKILNKTIAKSQSDYIIQIDGDCIIHEKFVEDHINNAKKNQYLYGSRVNILPEFVGVIFECKRIKFNYFSKEIKNKSRTLHIPFLASMYGPKDKVSKKFRGCNVSYWKTDFLEINGYNEDFEGWGREDSDLVIRMANKGVLGKRLRYSGILYHIYHKVNSKHNFEINDAIEQKTVKDKIVKIEKGVSQYL